MIMVKSLTIMAKKSSTPDEPDLAILLVAANRVLVDRLLAAMAGAGLAMRPSWGYVIRALYAEPLPLARLAERLDVTKQAALQTVDDMVAAGGWWSASPTPATDAASCSRSPPPTAGACARRRCGVSAAHRGRAGRPDAPAVRRALLGMAERHGDLEHVPRGPLARTAGVGRAAR